MEAVQENKMGNTPMLRLILSMSLPAMFSMLVQAMYNVVDSMFVAQIGENALTALSLVYPAQTLMIAVSVGTGVGINSLVSRKLGEGNHIAASSAANHGLILGFFSWVLFAILGFFFTKPFLSSFTSDASVLKMGCDYMYIVMIFSFGIFIEIAAEKILQATGNMIYPMVFQLIGAIINIILDPILIFGLLGFPQMGVAGAAIATVIGQILAMVYSLFIIFRKNHAVKISLRGFRFHWKTVRDIYSVGFPSIIMQAIMSVLVTGLNAILIAFSDAAVSVLGVYYRLQSFVFMPVFGMTQGVMPIMGYNFGARNKKRLMDALKLGSVIALIVMAIGLLIFMFLPDKLLMIFNASEEMMSIGVPALRIISLCFLPAALGIVFSTLFQAVGNGVYSLIVSVLRQLVLILPAAYLLSKLGLGYVWYAFPFAELISFLVSILLFCRLNKKLIKPMQAQS